MRFQNSQFIWKAYALDQFAITKQFEKLASFCNNDLSSKEVTSEYLQFKTNIKFRTK